MPQLSITRCCSSKSRDHHALNTKEYMKKGENLLDWKIPKIRTNKLYKIPKSPFTFFSPSRSIKTTEAKVSFGNGNDAIRLIIKNPAAATNTFRDKKLHTIFNVGLVQIGVKTLTKKIPQNASIILVVRDTRHNNFQDSILGVVESNLGDGPLYFNVFPNMTMSVFDPKLLNVLVLNVLVSGFEQLPVGVESIIVMFRTVYRLQSDTAPDALLESPDGKTVFFQTDVEDSNETVQRVCNWEDIVCKLKFSSGDANKA